MSKTVGAPPRGIDPNLYKWLDRVRNAIEKGDGQRPNQSKLDAYVKWRDLTDVGVVKFQGGVGGGGSAFVPIVGGSDTPNMSVPPTPTGLVAASSFSSIILEWDDPWEMYSNHGITEIHRAQVNDLGQAIVVGRTDSFVWADMNVRQGTRYYYWIRFVSDTDVAGPFNGTHGIEAFAKHNPDTIQEILTSKDWQPSTLYYDGQVVVPTTDMRFSGVEVHFQADNTGTSGGNPPPWHFVKNFGESIIDNGVKWIAVEAGKAPFITGTVDGKPMVFMHGAAIKDATIENAAIKTLAADKLFAINATVLEAIINKASIHRVEVGRDIRSKSYSQGRSGWRIGGDGNAEFNNVTVRGTVDSSKIRNSLFETDGFRYDTGGGRQAGFMIFWSDYYDAGTSEDDYPPRAITSPVYYSPNYGRGYSANRFSKMQQAVRFFATMSGDGPGFRAIELRYSVNSGGWQVYRKVWGDMDFRGTRSIAGTFTPPSSWGTLQFQFHSYNCNASGVANGSADPDIESMSGFIQVFNFQ